MLCHLGRKVDPTSRILGCNLNLPPQILGYKVDLIPHILKQGSLIANMLDYLYWQTLVPAPIQHTFRVQIAMDVALHLRHVYLTVKAATFHVLPKIYLVVMVAASLTKFAHLTFIVILVLLLLLLRATLD